MAIAMPSSPASHPDVRAIVLPVISALPGAAISTQPATAVLPHLSPILRQRVQLLSSASSEPWLRLLTYDVSSVPKLAAVAQGGSLEPHPVSGEIEVDWDYDVQTEFRRLDEETLQSLVALKSLDLFFRLVYCVNDKEGGGDGWRVGEVGVAGHGNAVSSFDGSSSISEAERKFGSERSASRSATGAPAPRQAAAPEEDEEEDDDDYWARYDATPARTPANQRSPAPASMTRQQGQAPQQPSPFRTDSAEDAYYAQYDNVQPAMDPHDPDEEVEHIEFAGAVPMAAGGASTIPRPAVTVDSSPDADLIETNGSWTLADHPPAPHSPSLSQPLDDEERLARLAHPRPASSASSNGSNTVAKLEETAERREQSEFGVKQHVARSIRSLFMLSRASGIDREEFERMVRTELDVLGMVEEDV